MPPSLSPALRGSWFLFLGALLGPAIIWFNRDPQGRAGMWLFLTAVMLGLLIHRLSLAYQFDQEEVRIRSWWGLGKPESIRWINLSRIYCQNSFTARAAGVSHLVLESSHPEESSLILLAQKKPEELRCRLLDLARARGARLSSPDGL